MKHKLVKKRLFKSVFAKLVSVFALVMMMGTPAFAALESIGPIDTTNGFPTAITDTNGVSLGQCLHPFHCAAAIGDLPDPSLPASFPGNWWDEQFWFTADSLMSFASPNGGGGSASLVLAVEGAYGVGPVLDGDQIMFSRIRFKADGLIAGQAYTVTHPYGVINVTAEADGTIFVTDDCGMGIPGDPGSFSRILTCQIGPFLQVDMVDPAIDPATGLPVDPPPAGFIASIAVENHVTGSPFGTNVFMIEGPGLGLNGVNTRLFTLTGKISNAPGASNVMLGKATYTRPLIGPSQAQVFASSLVNSQLTVSSFGGALAPLPGSMIMEQIMVPATPPAVGLVPSPDFFINVDLTPDLSGNLPRSLIVSDTTLNPPLNALSISLTDVVDITGATYNQATKQLTVNAASSDEQTALALVVLDLPAPGNALVGGSLTATLNGPIDTVTVQSSQGGVSTRNVVLVGPGSLNALMPDFAPPVADAGLDQVVFLDTRVDLSAAASTGTISNYVWTQIAGPPVAISNAFTSDIHFIYPTPPVTVPPTAPPTYTFSVSVVGPGGTSFAIVNVDATAVPPVTPTIDRAQAKLDPAKGDEWKITGTVSPVVAGATVTGIIVTDSFGNTADLIAASAAAGDTRNGIPADIDVLGAWAWSAKGNILTPNLQPGPWTIHAVSSTGTAGPEFTNPAIQ